MSGSKITDLTALSTAPADTDLYPIVDVSDTSMAATGTTKKITNAQLFETIPGSPAVSGSLILPITTGTGIKRGTASSSAYGWKDLIGDVSPADANPVKPTYQNYYASGAVNVFFFDGGANGDEADLVFHMPHDWVPGTDLHIHVHWGHNGTAISGSLVVTFSTLFARGFNQASNGTFGPEITTTLTVSGLTIGNTPQYRHRTDEVQLSAASPTANQLDTDNLEVDGLLLINAKVTTMPTITGSVSNTPQNKPAIFTIDLHYQSMAAGTTAGKAPNFYVP